MKKNEARKMMNKLYKKFGGIWCEDNTGFVFAIRDANTTETIFCDHPIDANYDEYDEYEIFIHNNFQNNGYEIIEYLEKIKNKNENNK
jgi:hypothetical protein